jgi:hypothetical protein
MVNHSIAAKSAKIIKKKHGRKDPGPSGDSKFGRENSSLHGKDQLALMKKNIEPSVKKESQLKSSNTNVRDKLSNGFLNKARRRQSAFISPNIKFKED